MSKPKYRIDGEFDPKTRWRKKRKRVVRRVISEREGRASVERTRVRSGKELINLAKVQQAKATAQSVTINIRTRQINRLKDNLQKQKTFINCIFISLPR